MRVLEFIRPLEPRLEGLMLITVNNAPVIHASIRGMSKPIPVQLLGEGLNRMFVLVLSMNDASGGLLLIDEIDNLRRFLRAFKSASGIENARSLAIVVDANSDRDARERSIRGTLSDMGLPTPVGPLELTSNGQLKVAYLIVPHGVEGTMIEDICLDSVRTDPAMKCVDRYFECIREADVPGPRGNWESKARVHAFLASREQPDLRLGEAAKRGVWSFETDSFHSPKELFSRCSDSSLTTNAMRIRNRK